MRFAGHDLLDRVAIALSALCLVHCIGTALLVALLATAGGALLSPAIHEVGLILAMTLAALALGRGYLRHRRVLPATLGGVGISAMALGLCLPDEVQEATLTMIGVTFVAAAHQLNRRHIASCDACGGGSGCGRTRTGRACA